MDTIQTNVTGRGVPRIALNPDEAATSVGVSRAEFQAIRNRELTCRKSGKATVMKVSNCVVRLSPSQQGKTAGFSQRDLLRTITEVFDDTSYLPYVALSERVCLSVGEAAALAGLSVSFLYILMERGALSSVKVHGRRLTPRPALDELLASHDQSATTPAPLALASRETRRENRLTKRNAASCGGGVCISLSSGRADQSLLAPSTNRVG